MKTSRAAAITFALALALPLAACGGDDPRPSGERPGDFAFTIDYVAGSVPPPYHDEWALQVATDGSATYTYTPDYPGDDVPTFTETFDVDDAVLDDAYDLMSDANLLADIDEGGEGLAGGSYITAEITAYGETYEVPAYNEDDEQPLDDETLGQLEQLIPADIRESIEADANAYSERKYGETP